VNGLINAACRRGGLVFGGPAREIGRDRPYGGRLQGTILRSSVTSSGADLYAFAAILPQRGRERAGDPLLH